MLKKFDHVTITVEDLERSVEFYRDILGLEVAGMLEQDEGNFKLVYLRSGDVMIELFNFTEKGKAPGEQKDIDFGLKHFGFKVDSVDEVTRKLKEQGVEFVLEPLDATGGVRIAFFKDPDGVLLEIVEGELELNPYKL
jgi:lactoylglutathione lyase